MSCVEGCIEDRCNASIPSMGRRLPTKLSPIGERLVTRMNELELEPGAVAAAAGISASTLYRLLRARSGTSEPRLRTKRALARVLCTPMAVLFDDPQLELLPAESTSDDRYHALLLEHYASVDKHVRVASAHAAARVLLDVLFSADPSGAPTKPDAVATISDHDQFAQLISDLYSRIPRVARPAAAREAIRAMLQIELEDGRIPPSMSLFDRVRGSASRSVPRQAGLTSDVTRAKRSA